MSYLHDPDHGRLKKNLRRPDHIHAHFEEEVLLDEAGLVLRVLFIVERVDFLELGLDLVDFALDLFFHLVVVLVDF